jgi:hypothetical protein
MLLIDILDVRPTSSVDEWQYTLYTTPYLYALALNASEFENLVQLEGCTTAPSYAPS